MDKSHTAEFWAQVEPVWSPYDPPSLRGVKIARITQKRPQDPVPGCLLVRLRITVPDAAFVSFSQVDISLPEGLFTVVPPVAVEAVAPDGNGQ